MIISNHLHCSISESLVHCTALHFFQFSFLRVANIFSVVTRCSGGNVVSVPMFFRLLSRSVLPVFPSPSGLSTILWLELTTRCLKFTDSRLSVLNWLVTISISFRLSDFVLPGCSCQAKDIIRQARLEWSYLLLAKLGLV
jgi:hypothetical protein